MQSITASRSIARRSTALECWPSGTVHTDDDVIIDASSLLHASLAHGTPLVHVGERGTVWPASAIASGGRSGHRRFLTVVLTRVEAVIPATSAGPREVWVDAELDRCRPILRAARLVGRSSRARPLRITVRPTSSDAGRTRLPSDLVGGDFLAIPCDGAFPLAEVRRRDHHVERLDDDRWDHRDEDPPLEGHCGR